MAYSENSALLAAISNGTLDSTEVCEDLRCQSVTNAGMKGIPNISSETPGKSVR